MASSIVIKNRQEITPAPGAQYTPGTSTMPWKLAFPSAAGTDNDTPLGTIAAKVPTTTLPETDEAAGRAMIPVAGFNFTRIKPYGTDAADETATFRVWEWRPVSVAGTIVYVPSLLYSANVVLGTSACTAIVASGVMADTITTTQDLTPSLGGIVLQTPRDGSGDPSPDNTPVAIVLDHGGADFLEIEAEVDTAATVNFLYTNY